MTLYYPFEATERRDWSDFVFIMPAVTIGNVGQLAVDLLLATLEVDLIGHIHCNAVLPFVGLDPFIKDSTNLVTSCQVYESKKLKIAIMQQRSPIAKNKRTEYVDFMTDWIKEKSFKKVIMLSSSLSQFQMPDSSLPMHFLCTPNQDDVKGYFQNTLKWKMVEQRDHLNYELTPVEDFHLLPGSGLTILFYKTCVKKKIPLVVIVHYCSEGDNIPDAIAVANSLNKWLDFIQPEWKKPVSWNLLFGNTFPRGMC